MVHNVSFFVVDGGLNNRDSKRKLKVYNNKNKLFGSVQPNLSWVKSEQIAHVPSPSNSIAQITHAYSLDNCVPLQRTTYAYFEAFSQLSFANLKLQGPPQYGNEIE